MKKNWLITGCSRGIGLELVKKILMTKEDQIFAVVRKKSSSIDLIDLQNKHKERLQIYEADLQKNSEIKALSRHLKDQPIDILVNNAGVFMGRGKNFEELTEDEILKTITINTLAPIFVTQTLLPNLQKSKAPKIFSITSKMGSIADNTSGGYYSYRISKTALNMFNASLAKDYPNITCMVLHPGWVKTEMGGSMAPLSVEDSVRGLYEVMVAASQTQSGTFVDYSGVGIPW